MQKLTPKTIFSGVKKWLSGEDAISSIPIKDLPFCDQPVAFALNISAWKREFVAKAYPEYHWVFLKLKVPFSNYEKMIRSVKHPVMFVWGVNGNEKMLRFVDEHRIPLFRMEDGFVRSLGLGANHNLPLSLVADRSGVLYFDPSAPSDLETLISESSYTLSELDEARGLMNKLINNKVSKYNTTSAIKSGGDHYDSYGEKSAGQKRILVIGQVEDDASIMKGGCGFDNGKLVWLARERHPDAQIFFKVHPDVLAGKRKIKTPLKEIENIAHVIREPLPMDVALETIDEVYTISSLSGFEAAMRGYHVVVAGQPFYAGYGITEDINPVDRRAKALPDDMTKQDRVAHIFRASYMEYPDYFNIFTKERINLPQAISLISIGSRMRDERERHSATLLTEEA